MKTTIVKCPICSKSVKWNDEFPDRPFCSKRCKLIDLGAWANDEYAVPLDDKPSSPDETANDSDYEHP